MITEKQKKQIEKEKEVADLFFSCPFPEPFLQFYDTDSEKLLDMKKDVLTQLINGVPYNEIPNFFDILELYPGNDVLWD
jgi:hypothetical protein